MCERIYIAMRKAIKYHRQYLRIVLTIQILFQMLLWIAFSNSFFLDAGYWTEHKSYPENKCFKPTTFRVVQKIQIYLTEIIHQRNQD